MSKINTVNAVAFIMAANMDAIQAKALKSAGDGILGGIFEKATKGLDKSAAGIVDNPATRIGFINGVVGLAHSHRVPELGMVASALFASGYGTLMDSAEAHMKDIAAVFTKSCMNLQLPPSLESEALAMVSGVKAGNPLDTVFNEARGGQHIIELPIESEIPASKPASPAPKADQPAAQVKVEEKSALKWEYFPTKESELKDKNKGLKECPVCGKDKKKDKMRVFSGTEMGVGDEWKTCIICAECKHGFTTESDKLKKAKADEYALIEAESKRKAAEIKAAARIDELTKEIAALVSTKEYQEAKNTYDVVYSTGVLVAAEAVTAANPDTLGKFESLQKELETLSKSKAEAKASDNGKTSAIADIVAQAS